MQGPRELVLEAFPGTPHPDVPAGKGTAIYRVDPARGSLKWGVTCLLTCVYVRAPIIWT